jgi:predicted MPP superfamily phosphohydrolase
VLAVIGVTLILAVWGLWLEPASISVVRERLPIPWAGPAIRIAVLTDLHVGSPFNGIGKLERIVRKTNEAHPDVICILGDLVIKNVPGGAFVAPERIGEALAHLRAPGGVYAVLGNHDGWFDSTRIHRALTAAGIHVLVDTAVRVETLESPIWVGGISDLWTGRHDVARTVAAIDDSVTPALFITHNPDVFPEVPRRIGLTIAGHTHGGQVNLPFIGPLVVPSRFGRRYAAGLVTEGDRHLFVATGVGTSVFPVRFRVPPTINILEVGGLVDSAAARLRR